MISLAPLVIIVYPLGMAVKDFLSSTPDLYQAGPREWIRVLGRELIQSELFGMLLVLILLVLSLLCLLFLFERFGLLVARLSGIWMLLGSYLMALIFVTRFYWNLFRDFRDVLMRTSLWIHSPGWFILVPVLAVLFSFIFSAGVMLPIVLNAEMDTELTDATMFVPRFQSAWANFCVLVYMFYHIPAAVILSLCFLGPFVGAVRVHWIAGGLRSSSNDQIAVERLYRIAVNPWAWPKSRSIALAKLSRTPNAIKFLGEHQGEIETLAASPYKPVALAAQQALYETSRRLRYSQSVE